MTDGRTKKRGGGAGKGIAKKNGGGVYGKMTNGGQKKKEKDMPSQEDGEMG